MLRYLLLCGFLLCAACQPRVATPPAIHFVIAQAPLTLDPRYATDAASERINRLLYQPLVDFDSKSQPIAKLATWVQIDARHYRFTLKTPRAPFHDHTPLRAQDVVATYQSLMQLSNSPRAAEFTNIEAVRALDADTVLFQLKQADMHFPEKLIIGIMPAHWLQRGHDFSRQPIGSGPLSLVRWHRQLILERVRDRQLIVLEEVKDPTVRVLKLIRGEADLIQGDLPPELVDYLAKKTEVAVQYSVGANFSYLGLNLQDPVLSQRKVRLALAYAIDRKAIMDHVMVRHTRLADAILPPEHYAGNGHLAHYPYNPALSRKLLQAAGITLPLHLVYKTSTDAQRVRLATIFQAQMAKAGIALEIRSLDWGTFFEDIKKGHFQLFGLTWVGIRTPDIYAKAFGSAYFPPKGFNRGHYRDATLDALLAQENWQAATARIQTQLPYIPLWYEGQFAAMRRTIKNYSPKADGNWDDLATITQYAH